MQPNQPARPSTRSTANSGFGATAATKPDPADRRVEALDLAIKSFVVAPNTVDIVARAEAFAKFITG